MTLTSRAKQGSASALFRILQNKLYGQFAFLFALYPSSLFYVSRGGDQDDVALGSCNGVSSVAQVSGRFIAPQLAQSLRAPKQYL